MKKIALLFLIFWTTIHANLTDDEQEILTQLIEQAFPPIDSISLKTLDSAYIKQNNRIRPLHSQIIRIRILNRKIYYLYSTNKNPAINLSHKHGDKNASGLILPLIKQLVQLEPDLQVDFIYFEGPGPKEEIFDEPIPYLAANSALNKTRNVILFTDRITWNDYSHLDNNFLPYGFNITDYSWLYLTELVERHSASIPWEKKADQLIWRGRPLDGSDDVQRMQQFPRGRLVALSSTYPEWINAQFTWFAGKCTKAFLSIYDQLQYKFQISLDGITCTNPGFAWRLLSNCTVLKVNSPNYQWFYSLLKPWYHYVPIQENLEDLIEVLQFLKNHDDLAKKIAQNGTDFAKKYLRKEFQFAYFLNILKKYEQLQNFSPSEEDEIHPFFTLYYDHEDTSA